MTNQSIFTPASLSMAVLKFSREICIGLGIEGDIQAATVELGHEISVTIDQFVNGIIEMPEDDA